MSPRCILIGLQCPLCGSPVVRVSEADVEDRLICPICWAAGDCAAVMDGRARLERGSRIESQLRFLVDRARFPKPPTSAGPPPNAKSETADLAAADASQGLRKAPPERA